MTENDLAPDPMDDLLWGEDADDRVTETKPRGYVLWELLLARTMALVDGVERPAGTVLATAEGDRDGFDPATALPAAGILIPEVTAAMRVPHLLKARKAK